MKKIVKTIILGAIMIIITSLTQSCTTIEPHERELLSEAIMREGSDPLAIKQREHVFFTREAASGGKSVGGGGCGCN